MIMLKSLFPLNLVAVFLFLPLLAMAAPASGQVQASRPTIKLGLTGETDATKRDVEFQQYDHMVPVLRDEQIEASLMTWTPFYEPGLSGEQLDALLRGYHAIHFRTTEVGIARLTPKLEAHARMVGAALVKYVEEGGGLFLEVQPVRYAGAEDEKYWNIVLEPLGIQIPHEGIFDKTRTFEQVLMYGRTPLTFWFTKNFSESPLLENVRGLCLPESSSDGTPGVPALTYSKDWKIVVRGEEEAQSYLTRDDNVMSTEKVGTYSSAPPIVAERQMGKGRMVSYPLARIFTGMNHLNPIWPDVVESKGFPEKGWPSDSMRLQLNAYRWMGENAAKLPDFGTHKISPVAPIHYSDSKSWDNEPFPGTVKSDSEVKGIIGARSEFGGGNGTVAEYVQAAKDAGLGFIVFSDPLEKLTAESLEALKAACAKENATGDFYAAPGIQFTDGAGIRWAIWGENFVYPPATMTTEDRQKDYPLWDGKQVLERGYYLDLCGQPGGGVLSFKGLRENKSHPENLWWYWHYFPRVYENNKLVEDQYAEYLFGLRDLRHNAIASYTGIDSPAKVEEAAKRFFTSLPDLASVKRAFNTHFGEDGYGAPWWPKFYVSEGPRIVEWTASNAQMEENVMFTRGAQRVRLRLDVRSENGIKEIKVHDADRGVVRRFAGNGVTEMTREFELVHDRQRYLALEVTDGSGKKAFSQAWVIFSYKQGLFRCGDNLNILGPLGLQWHPDRNQFFDATKNFQNGMDFEVRGVDTSIPILPMPDVRLTDTVEIKGVGSYPTHGTAPGMTSKLMDVQLGSTNMQIATMKLENLAQFFETDERPQPAYASSPQDVSENEYFIRTHKLISLRDRIDWYTSWNHRRGREGRKNYLGSFNWHEGEITFKKDVVLQGAVPIPLVRMTSPYDVEKGWGTHFIVASNSDEVKDTTLVPGKEERFEGRIQAGGFISQLPSLVGYQAFFAAPETEYAYCANLPGRVEVGLGHDGQKVKAGTVFKYRFAMGIFTDTRPDAALLRHTSLAMNLAGGSKGYPLKVEIGKLKDAAFFLTLEAQENEAKFTVGPESLIIDLPVVVQGIEDNGCAAVYTTNQPWFRFVSVVDGTAYLQEPIDKENAIWVGNLFTAGNKEIKLTAVIDGQNRGRKPFLEVHNPTDKFVQTTIRSPRHVPQFGGLSTEVTIPAGGSIRLEIQDGTLVTPKSE